MVDVLELPLKLTINGKIGFSHEGGLLIRLTNKTGAASVKGSVVSASGAANDAFILQASEYDALGIVYESGIPDGQECFVVVSGIAEVLLKNSTASTRGHVVFSADTDGRAVTGEVPAPPNADAHFKEIGHCIETKTGGTDVLTKVVIHFN